MKRKGHYTFKHTGGLFAVLLLAAIIFMVRTNRPPPAELSGAAEPPVALNQNASINLTPPPRAAAPAPVLATTQPSSIIPKVTRKEEPRINRMIENGRTVEQRTFLSSDGQMEIVQTLLETHHKYPLIRIHRSYQVNEDGTRHLHEEYAAPVDHLLVQTDLPADDLAAQLPAGLKIQSHLRTQGAYVIKLPEANLDSIDTGLAALASLAHAEPDYMYYLNETVPNDAQFPSQAAMQNVNDHDIDAPEAWDIQTGSSNIVVAIIDTGMDYNHPDLAPNIWNNPAEALGIPGVDDDGNGYVDDIHGWDFYFNDADPFDDSSHGTHVAGIIGAVGNNNIGVAGVNWQIRMAAVKAFSIDNAGFTSDIVEAMAYTRIMGFDIGYHAYGTHVDSPFLTSAIDELGLAGQIFVTLAGGTEADIDLDPYYPASHPGDHVIVATTSDTEDHRPYWANTGALSVDLAAPGVDILSTLLNGSYGRKSGVSMSGAFVAGACALLKAQYPASDSGAIKARLLAGVDPLADFQGQVASHGRLNLHRAISIASPPRAPTAPDQLYSSYNGLDEVDLDWNDNSDDEIEFAIERKQGFDGTFVEIGRSDADQPFYIDLAPIPGVENIYRVKALGAVVDSGYSNELVIDLPPPGDVWDPLDDNPANGTLLSGSTSTVESVHGVHSLSSLDTVDWFTIQLDEGETYQFSLESLRGTEVRMIVYYPGDFSGGPELISFGGRTIMHYQAEDSGLFNIAVRVGAQANSATYNLYYSRVVERNPPSIFILQPEPGDIWPVEQGRAEIVAQVTEIDHTVEHVEFYANGTLFATDALTEAANGTSLHTVEYVFTTPGPVELMAIVHDAYGLMATSEVVQVEVATPPRVEIVNPIAGLSRPVGVPVLIETEVDVPAGQRIVESRIIQRSKNIVLPPSPPVPGQVNETIRRWYGPPEDINWIPAHLGELDLFAEVTFSDGRTTQSAPVPITLTNAIAVQITSPIDGIYTNTSTLTFAAEILGQTQQVDEVRFIFDGDLIGVFHQPPYTLEWTNTTPITAAFSVIAFITNVPPSLTFGRVDVDLRYFPTNPTNLIAQFLAPASTELHWVDTSSNEVGFEIEQSTDGTNFTLIATVDANQTSFEAETVTPNQDYYHRVRAINESGESPYSNIARIETSVATQPISGEVIYTGAQTGFVHVVLYKLPGLTVLDETVLTAPGSFTFPNQKRFNEYRISAFIDADLSSQLDFFEARGQTPAFMVDDPVTNLVIQLVDPDSDDDRLPDYEEIVLGTNPHEPDSDFDDAWDGVEVIDFPCLDPMDPDTDGDGIMDGVEIASDSDPCDPNDPLNENHGISGTVNYGGTYQGPVYVGAFTDDALAGAFLDDFEEPALDPGWIAFGFGGATTVGVSTGETASGTQALTFRSEGVGAQEAIAIRNFPHPVMSGSISWWHYDNVETARHSVFMSIGAEDFTEALSVNLYDVTFDDLYYEVCGDGPCSRGAARSTGWHEYVVTFTGGVARLSIDGVFAVESREFAGGLASVSMVYVNDHNGVQEARFDLLQTHNATIRYQTMLAGPGAFNLSELPGLSTYELRAFMDLNDNGLFDVYEPNANYQNNPFVLTNELSGVALNLVDPDRDLDGLSDATELGFGRYEIVLGAFSWQDAVSDAQGRGGHLATIMSYREWQAIRTVLGTDIIAIDAWLGGTDQDVESVWAWITGESWAYSRWFASQPDDLNMAEDFLAIGGSSSPTDLLWVDAGSTRPAYILERGFYSDPDVADTDGDGLNDSEELAHSTFPGDPDSDNDDLSDGDEIALGTDPLDPDSDDDGLSDGFEVDIVVCTDPLDPDSDGDLVKDGDEVDARTNPCDGSVFPAAVEGTVFNQTGLTGTLYVVAYNNLGDIYELEFEQTGQTSQVYRMAAVYVPETYEISAFLDTDANGRLDDYDPFGAFAGNPNVVTGNQSLVDIVLALPITSVVYRVQHQAADYLPGDDAQVTVSVWIPDTLSAAQFSYHPALPDGWTLSGTDAGSLVNTSIVFSAPFATNAFSFTFTAITPPNTHAPRILRADTRLLISGSPTVWPGRAQPDPLAIYADTPYHSADWRLPFGVIDDGEYQALVALHDATGYHLSETTRSGYAPGPGLQMGRGHDADYWQKDWKIEPRELYKAAVYWHVGCYKADPSSSDGFIGGCQTARPSSLRVASNPVFQYNGQGLYQPGSQVTVELNAEHGEAVQGFIWLWTAPPGWILADARFDGNGERAGEAWIHRGGGSSSALLTFLVPFDFTGDAILGGSVRYVDDGVSGDAELNVTPFLIQSDIDDDGLADWKENNNQRFSSASDTGTSATIADTDGDGARDGDEIVAGTNPLDARSVLRLSLGLRDDRQITLQAAGALRITWPGVFGKRYDILAGPSLEGPFLPVIEDVVGLEPLNVETVLIPPGARKQFFKIQVAE